MATINLRTYYPFYHHDEFVEVSDELADEMEQWERNERSLERKKRRYRAQYSLDRDDGIENHILFGSESPEDHYIKEATKKQLEVALLRLSHKQAKRIYAYYYLWQNKAEIARKEGVGRGTVGDSIFLGLKKLEKYLRDFDERGAHFD